VYTPPSFQVDEPAKLFEMMAAYPFATLVTSVGGKTEITHLPVLVERDSGEMGTVIGHIARANLHWKETEGVEAVVVFQGPHAYISPRWYEAHNVVPTWNYVAVHARGRLAWTEDRDELRDVTWRYVEQFERTFESPWSMETNDESLNEGLLEAIVGFRLTITHLEGKCKLGQNHDAHRRLRVATALQQRDDTAERRIGEMMMQSIEGSD